MFFFSLHRAQKAAPRFTTFSFQELFFQKAQKYYSLIWLKSLVIVDGLMCKVKEVFMLTCCGKSNILLELNCSLIGLMEIGYGIPNGLHENIEDGKDIKMSEFEEGELVEMISKTELGENSALVSKIESQETRAGAEDVEAIQACGGQKTADGRRFRVGGGILWKVIKAREPNAYKDIMKRGKEFEKQLKQVPKTPLIKREAKDAASQNTLGTVTDKLLGNASDGSSLPSNMVCDSQEESTSGSGAQRQSVYNRIRMPVSYDDLFEEDVQHNAI
nr:uncharacterized protein LOC109179755 [Ipomoea batatas]